MNKNEKKLFLLVESYANPEKIEKFLMQKDVNVNVKRYGRETVLDIVLGDPQREVLTKILRKFGAKESKEIVPEARSRVYESALIKAIREENLEYVKDHLDFCEKDYEFQRSLHLTAQNGNIEIFKMLLAYKNSNWILTHGPNDVIEIAARNRNVGFLEELFSIGISYKSSIYSRHTPLMYAAENGHIEEIKILIKLGVSTELQTNKYINQTPLQLALNNNQLEAVKTLLEYGAKANTPSCTLSHPYDTPINMAIDADNLEMVKLLLKYGAKCSKSMGSFDTPLHKASKKGNIEIINELLNHKRFLKHINQRNRAGKTPLDESECENQAIIKLFRDHGARSSQELEEALTIQYNI